MKAFLLVVVALFLLGFGTMGALLMGVIIGWEL